MSKGNAPSNRKTSSSDSQKLEPVLQEGIKGGDVELIGSRSITSKLHSGPLPDPQTLREYNSIIPNGADRIMKQAEKEQDHRIDIQSKVINSQVKQSKVGQYLGFTIGLVGICCGTFLAYMGQEIVGSIMAGGTVVSLVSVFVLGKKYQKK